LPKPHGVGGGNKTASQAKLSLVEFATATSQYVPAASDQLSEVRLAGPVPGVMVELSPEMKVPDGKLEALLFIIPRVPLELTALPVWKM
jgi:hypothetical protein